MCACALAHIRACVYVCVCACVYMCVRACICVCTLCLCVCKHLCTCAFAHACIYVVHAYVKIFRVVKCLVQNPKYILAFKNFDYNYVVCFVALMKLNDENQSVLQVTAASLITVLWGLMVVFPFIQVSELPYNKKLWREKYCILLVNNHSYYKFQVEIDTVAN